MQEGEVINASNTWTTQVCAHRCIAYQGLYSIAISSFAFQVLFCSLHVSKKITYSLSSMKDLFPLIVIQLLRYFGCFPGMFFKKSQSLAFQVLSYSVRFHCCYILLCGSSNPTNHLHVAQVAPVILLFPFMGLLRYLKMIGFVYSVEFEQPGSGDKNCCICLKIAWGIYVHFFLSKVHPLITSVEY